MVTPGSVTPGSCSRDEEETCVVAAGATDQGRADEGGEGARLNERPGPSQGSRVGRYVVLERLGAGGMGVVVRAYDPKLRREVALKVMRVGRAFGRAETEARMLREAQALARLSDPHVVAVYDAERTDHGVCIAMEYVEGRTLDRWLGEQTPRWREVLEVVVAMARGLAAAHAAGVVHRDVKPANVLVGTDGRVRLTDFGIAHTGEDALSMRSSGDGVVHEEPHDLTRAGAVLGTPAYMAPEQHGGTGVDARADQYALCVLSWQALYGQRPFRGANEDALCEAKLRGAPPRPASSVPTWVHAVLVRGLAVEPDARWPSMEALVAALVSGQRRARRRRVAVAVGVAACMVAAGLAWHWWQRATLVAMCEHAGESIAEVWNDEARETLRSALLGTGVTHAEETATKVMPWLDAQAQAWQDARTQACLDARLRGTWDAHVLDRSQWCLDERRMELEALVAELSRGEVESVDKAVGAAVALVGVDGCRNADLLVRQPTPPRAQQDELALVRAELSRVRALARTGAYEEGLATARAALGRAEALEWPLLSAAIRVQLGSLLERMGDHNGAAKTVETAYFEAAHAGASEVAVQAADQLAFTVGHQLARHEEGLRWARHAKVMLATLPDPVGTKLAAHYGSLANVHYARGDYEEAKALHEQALAIREKAFGTEHPHVAMSLNGLAGVHHVTGDYEQAKALQARAVAIEEKTLGPEHPTVASGLNNLAGVYHARGEHEEAKVLLERALVIRERVLGPEHPDVATSLNNLAFVHQATGGYEEAKALLERGLAIFEKALGPEHPEVAWGLNNLASVHQATNDHEQAKVLLERAVAIWEKALGPEHPRVAYSLVGLAEVALVEDRAEEAVEYARRAVSLRETTASPGAEIAVARFVLARSLWAAKHERARALELAAQARDGFRGVGPAAAESLAEVDAWLDEHGAKR
jgi:eukaryotic-like serine/threonine-protein kinase